MIRNCKNCAGRLVYDITQKKLSCEACGAHFDVDDYSSVSQSHKLIDTNIYTCNSCGASISVTDTEASTYCIYCGNPTVVFSRIAQVNKPDMIIPFDITKEYAIKAIRAHIGRGFFIPKEIKNVEVDLIRGIYIPYYVTSVEFDGSYIIRSDLGENDTDFYKRSGYVSMPWVTTDASSSLDDSASQRLEPFYLDEFKEFNENYLLGFYSDISDVNEESGVAMAKIRARETFEKEMFDTVPGINKKIIRERVDVEVYQKPVTAMLPAWFLTFRYNDTPYTFLVNGQTGKVVGAVPFNKKLFFGFTAILAVLLSSVMSYLLCVITPIIYGAGDQSFIYYLILIALIVASSFITGFRYMKRVYKSIKRTSQSALSGFAKKRQG